MSRRASARRLLQLWCIALLLFAQQAALTHSIAHASAGSRDAAQQQARSPAHESEGLKLSPLCALDAVFGQVLGAAPVSSVVHCVSESGCDERSERAAPGITLRFLAPLSRGPPALT